MRIDKENSTKVCVTGGAGYIGYFLVKKLLERGYVVHTTLRNIGDSSKTGLLNSIHGAESRLLLFEADIYNPGQFKGAIKGCEFVFLLATPYQHIAHNFQYKDTTEAAVASIRSIMLSCKRSGTVKRVIYTGSVTASSPMKEDGISFRDFIDESCWTPLGLSLAHCEDLEKDYVSSKTLSEKEAMSYNNREGYSDIEVVSLVCGLVGGDAQLPYVPALLCSVPLVHIVDICEAHVFCMERPSMAGRFLCVSTNPTMQELVDYYEQMYPELIITKQVEGTGRKIECRSTKLADMGFEFRYGMEQIVGGSVEFAKRMGELKEGVSK